VAVTSDEQVRAADEELAWERLWAPRAGLAALGAAAFTVGSFFVQLPMLRDRTKNEAETLLSVHKHAAGFVAGGTLQLLAMLFIAVVLWYLYRAAKHRRPQTPSIALVLGIGGPVLFGVVGAISPFVVKHFAAEFAAGANKSNQHAKDLVSGSAAQVFGIVSVPSGLALVFAMVMNNINVMRAGLVSTFVGIIGVIAGLLFVIPLGPPQLLLFFWLVSVGVVVLDRWPGGRGPAWASGMAVKWPSPAERRGQMAGRARGQRPEATGQRPQATGSEPEPEPDLEPPGPSRTSRKRKRKQGRKH
jgi:hypothetical protein